MAGATTTGAATTTVGATTTGATTTAAATTTAGATTAAAATIPPVLIPNSNVDSLSTAISNQGCSSSQFCASEPRSCNPSVAGSCFFVGARRTAGRNFEFGLSGQSNGYIGCTLSPDNTLGGGDTTYVCANNNGRVEFIGTILRNGQLIRQTVNANSVRGRIDGNRIQCRFAATIPDATARTTASTFSIAVVTGTFNPSTGALGAPRARVQTGRVELGDPNSNSTNVLSSGRPTHQALSQALLIILGTMGLTLL